MSATATKRLPPTDTNGELAKACLILARFRRELHERSGLNADWQRWIVSSLIESCPLTQEEE